MGPCEGHGDLRADRDGVKLKEGGKGRAPRVSEDSAAGCVLEGQTQVSVPREGGQEAAGPRGDRGSSVPLSRYGCSLPKGGEGAGCTTWGTRPAPRGKMPLLLSPVFSPFGFHSVVFLLPAPVGRPPGMRESWGEGWDLALGKPGQAFRGAAALNRGQ